MDAVKNFGKVVVTTTYGASDVTVVLDSADGAKLPQPSTDGEFNLVWWDSTTYPDPCDDPRVEIVRCTARVSDTLTITRAQESTTASTKNTANVTYLMMLGPTAKTITDMAASDLSNVTTPSIPGSLVSATNNTYNIGSTTNYWKDAYIRRVNIVSTPTADKESSGIICTFTAHESMAFGDVCYINTSGEAQLANADAVATSYAMCMCVSATVSASATGIYMLYGFANNTDWAWTVGSPVFVSTTGTSTNTLTQTSPSGTDDVIQIMGIATHADRMYFNPQLVQVEHK